MAPLLNFVATLATIGVTSARVGKSLRGGIQHKAPLCSSIKCGAGYTHIANANVVGCNRKACQESQCCVLKNLPTSGGGGKHAGIEAQRDDDPYSDTEDDYYNAPAVVAEAAAMLKNSILVSDVATRAHMERDDDPYSDTTQDDYYHDGGNKDVAAVPVEHVALESQVAVEAQRDDDPYSDTEDDYYNAPAVVVEAAVMLKDAILGSEVTTNAHMERDDDPYSDTTQDDYYHNGGNKEAAAVPVEHVALESQAALGAQRDDDPYSDTEDDYYNAPAVVVEAAVMLKDAILGLEVTTNAHMERDDDPYSDTTQDDYYHNGGNKVVAAAPVEPVALESQAAIEAQRDDDPYSDTEDDYYNAPAVVVEAAVMLKDAILGSEVTTKAHMERDDDPYSDTTQDDYYHGAVDAAVQSEGPPRQSEVVPQTQRDDDPYSDTQDDYYHEHGRNNPKTTALSASAV